MADSLRDQLLKSGLVQKLKAEARPPERAPQRGQPAKGARPERAPQKGQVRAPAKPPRGERPPRSQDEIDLARAYALRERAEREQRERDQQQAQQRAKEKAERKQKLAALLGGKSLNREDADVARHFQHGDKIRRVYCTAAQLTELNLGKLAVVQHLGRYQLVSRDVGEQARAINPDALVLLCDPDAPADDDIPADLIWCASRICARWRCSGERAAGRSFFVGTVQPGLRCVHHTR